MGIKLVVLCKYINFTVDKTTGANPGHATEISLLTIV